MATQWGDGFSAHVEIYFLHNGEKLDISRIGPETFTFRESQVLPPRTTGDLVIKVDDKEDVQHVLLYEGSAAGMVPVKYT